MANEKTKPSIEFQLEVERVMKHWDAMTKHQRQAAMLQLYRALGNPQRQKTGK